MLHMVTQGAWALMPKAAPKGGSRERCPCASLHQFCHLMLGWLGISLRWWKTEAHFPQPWYWKGCKTLMDVVVKVEDSAFLLHIVPGMARTVTFWG